MLKNYIYKSFDKILTGKAIIKDFIFAKEVSFGTYRGENLPPSALIAYKKHLKDNNYLPRYKEREPYLVINNTNGLKRLKDCIVSPEDFLKNKNYFLNTRYYIEKQILPSINRILEPINVDIYEWYKKYPRPAGNNCNLYYDSRIHFISNGNNVSKGNFFKSAGNQQYNLLKDDQNKNSKSIDQYLKDGNLISKKSIKISDAGLQKRTNNILSNTSKSVKKIKNYVHQKADKNNFREFLPYRKKVHELLMNDGTYELSESSNDERLREISKIIKSNLYAKKLSDYENICRFCSEFERYNIYDLDLACNMYLCKIYYEKLLLVSKQLEK